MDRPPQPPDRHRVVPYFINGTKAPPAFVIVRDTYVWWAKLGRWHVTTADSRVAGKVYDTADEALAERNRLNGETPT